MSDNREHEHVSLDEIQALARRVQTDKEYAEKFKEDPEGTLQAAGITNAFRAKVVSDGSEVQRMVPVPDLWCLRWGDTYVCIPYPPWF